MISDGEKNQKRDFFISIDKIVIRALQYTIQYS